MASNTTTPSTAANSQTNTHNTQPPASTAKATGVDKSPVAPGSTSEDNKNEHQTAEESAKRDLPLPHERDEKVGKDATASTDNGAAGDKQRATIGQAKKDLDKGQVDTDMRATSGLDAQRRDDLTRRTP